MMGNLVEALHQHTEQPCVPSPVAHPGISCEDERQCFSYKLSPNRCRFFQHSSLVRLGDSVLLPVTVLSTQSKPVPCLRGYVIETKFSVPVCSRFLGGQFDHQSDHGAGIRMRPH
jgi:hypothetical protein